MRNFLKKIEKVTGTDLLVPLSGFLEFAGSRDRGYLYTLSSIEPAALQGLIHMKSDPKGKLRFFSTRSEKLSFC